MEINLILWDRGLIFSTEDIPFDVVKLTLGTFDSWLTMFYLPIWWIFIFFWLFIKDQDIIHVANFDSYIIALIVAKIKRKKIIYEIIDFYGDTVTVPILPKLFGKILGDIDRFLLNFADVIIIADKSRIEQIGTDKKNIIVVNNSPKDIIDKKFIDKKNGRFTVFYGGQILYQRGIDQIILAVKDIPEIDLIIMGYCSSQEYRDKLMNISKNIKNIKLILEFVPHKEIIQQSLRSDIIIALYDPEIPNNRYASPNKLFEAMMCGKPLIVNDKTSMVDIITKERCGLIIPYGNIDKLKYTIKKLKNNEKLCYELGKNGRKAYESYYSWSIMEKRLFKIYKDLD